jgi:hypothetical protein
MNKIKVDKSELGDILSGDGTEEDAWELIEEGEWVQDYKYQFRAVILRRKSDDTYWRYGESRTGSAFSEYHYDDQYEDHYELVQVKKVYVTVHEWMDV